MPKIHLKPQKTVPKRKRITIKNCIKVKFHFLFYKFQEIPSLCEFQGIPMKNLEEIKH